MGTGIQLTAPDGHLFEAYLAQPAGTPRGGLVVAPEIFGINSHIRGVADGYARDGYLAIAPALFDRASRGYEAGYSQEDIQQGIAIMQKIPLDRATQDVAVAVGHVARAGRVGIVGYCWGGTVAWKAASTLDVLACAIAYYGGGIPNLIHETPHCPVLFHWGETDHSIPLDKARAFAAAHADQVHHFYPAGHGFNCEQRGSFQQASAELARQRTLEFLGRHVG